MSDVHKVFVSFHSADQEWKKRFEKLCKDVIESRSVNDGDIDANQNAQNIRRLIRDNNLRDSTVTVVLVGKLTWQRKHVDWEISSSIRDTEYNPRSGLLGIFLPTRDDYGKEKYDPYTIPPRLYDNAKKNSNGVSYALLYDWSDQPDTIQKWVERAFQDRKKINPDIRRPMFGKNWSGDRWQE